jgi:hypothetical protein
MLHNRIPENVQADNGYSGETFSKDISSSCYSRLIQTKEIGEEHRRFAVIYAWQEGYIDDDEAVSHLINGNLFGTKGQFLTCYAAGLDALRAKRDAEALSHVDRTFEAVEPYDGLPIAPPNETLLEALASGRRG